ncbi:hypothetical protein ACIOWI_35290 [Streptomyces sp. NPDC087659]|uniref:hypothetical protein n=1 Tax=Streptomyces sp. NPDC087659 TaxID=3365801 RepID=UPI0038144600
MILSLTRELLRSLSCPPDIALADLVSVVNWAVQNRHEALVKHAHVVYAMVRQKNLKDLLSVYPDLSDALSTLPRVLGALTTAGDRWYKEALRIGPFLLREEISSTLESDTELLSLIIEFPEILPNLHGRLELLREIMIIDEPVLSLAKNSPAFGSALIELERQHGDPVAALWRLGSEVALGTALITKTRMYAGRSFADVFQLLLTDDELCEIIRRYPAQLNLLVSSAEILRTVKAMPAALHRLSASKRLTDVLEHLPDLALRLLMSMNLINAAVDNDGVAYALSCNPHLYDDATTANLEERLRSTIMPAGFAPDSDDNAVVDTIGRLRELVREIIEKDPAADHAEAQWTERGRSSLVSFLLAYAKGHLLDGFPTPGDSDSDKASTMTLPKMLTLLRGKSPAVDVLFRSRDPLDKERTRALLVGGHEDLIRHMIRYPRVITMPHQLRRIIDLKLLQNVRLPEDPFAALHVLLNASRHTLIYQMCHKNQIGSTRTGFTLLITMLPDFRARLYDSPVLVHASAFMQSALQQLRPGLLADDPWLTTALRRNIRLCTRLSEEDWEDSAELSALVAEESALSRLFSRHRFVDNLTPEEWGLVMANIKEGGAGPLKRLAPVFGQLPQAYWQRLLTGKLYRLLSERHEHRMTEALVRFPHVLREAVARPGFTEAWETQPDYMEELARRAVQAGDAVGNSDVDPVQTLVGGIIGKAGDATLTERGFELDQELVGPVGVLIAGLERQSAPATFGEAANDFSQDVMTAYGTVLNDKRLRPAAVKNRYLAQGLFYTPSMLDLLTTRPSLLDQFERSPEILRQLMRVVGLPRLLAHHDEAYTRFIDEPYTRLNFDDEWVETTENNPDFIRAFNIWESAGTIWDMNLYYLIVFSPAVARAIIDHDGTLQLLDRASALTSRLRTSNEIVVQAVLATPGRLNASAANSSLVDVLNSMPEEIVTVLADRSDLAPSAEAWVSLLNNSDLLARLSAHPSLAGAVLTPDLLPVLCAAPLFVEVFANASEQARARLTAEPVRELIRRYPQLADELLRVPALLHALNVVRGLPALLSKQYGMLQELTAAPELIDAILANRNLIDEADRHSPAWEVVSRHPALATGLTSTVRNALNQQTGFSGQLLRYDGLRSAEDAARLIGVLRNRRLVSLLSLPSNNELATAFLRQPTWQEAFTDRALTEGLHDLHNLDPDRLAQLIAHADPSGLLNACMRTIRTPHHTQEQATRTPQRTTPSAAASTAPSGRPEATPPKAKDVVEPVVRPTLPWEVTRLLDGPSGARVAEAMAENPELLPLLTAEPAVAEELINHPEWIDTYLLASYLAHDLPPVGEGLLSLTHEQARKLEEVDFQRQFSGFLASVGINPGEHTHALKAAAHASWRKQVGRLREERSTLQVDRTRRFKQFRAHQRKTWHHSGRVHYASSVTQDFTDLQQHVIDRAAHSGEGIRGPQIAINKPLHAHLDSGHHGVAFFYALADDGKVDLVVYAKSTSRSGGNKYRWDNYGAAMSGAPELENIRNDPHLRRSEHLVAHGPDGTETPRSPKLPLPDADEKAAVARAQALAAGVTAYHKALTEFAIPGIHSSAGTLIKVANDLRDLGMDLFTYAWEGAPHASTEVDAFTQTLVARHVSRLRATEDNPGTDRDTAGSTPAGSGTRADRAFAMLTP